MLARIELQALDFIYSKMNLKLFQMPLSWKNGRILVRKVPGQFNNFLIWSLVIIHLIYCLIQLRILVHNKRVNSAAVQMIFVTFYLTHLVVRMNISVFKTELARIINQTLTINSISSK